MKDRNNEGGLLVDLALGAVIIGVCTLAWSVLQGLAGMINGLSNILH